MTIKAAAITVFFVVSSVIASINVSLEVANWANITRTGDPVTAGVPLPEGAVNDISKLRITDISGNSIPCQFRVLSRWYRDKHSRGIQQPSIKWVLCDFQSDVAAKNKTGYFLKDDNNAGSPSTQLTLAETATAVTVVTGPLKFILSKTRFNLFDEAWIDANNNNSFEEGEKIFAAGNNSGGFITAGDWTAGECIPGTVHKSTERAVDRVVIEENGPMKMVVRVEGRHFATTNTVSRGLYGYQVFITAYAGKPYVDVQWALTNMHLEGIKPRPKGATTTSEHWTMFSWPFTKYTLSLDLNLNTSATQPASLLPKDEFNFNADGTPAVLDQRFRSYTCIGGATGEGAKGAVSISDGTKGVRVAMRYFGTNSPKSMSVTKGKIDLGLFPDNGDTLPYWLETRTRKNHRMRFEFFGGSPVSGALNALWEKTEAPLRMLASDPAWYRNTNAWERGFGLVPGTKNNITLFKNRIQPSAWQRYDRYKADFSTGDYAWQYDKLTWIFGGIPTVNNFNSGGDHPNLTSMFYQYLLTGDPIVFDRSEMATFFFNDRVQEQFPHDIWQKFDFWLNPLAHISEWGSNTHAIDGHGQTNYIQTVAFPGYALRHDDNIPDAGHMTQLQELEYYQLTGDHATLDAMKGLAAEAAAHSFGWHYIWNRAKIKDSINVDSIYQLVWGPRYPSRPSMVLMHAYDVTGDEKYLYPAKLLIYGVANYVKRHPVGYMAIEGNTTYCRENQNPWTTDHPGDSLPKYFSVSDFQIGIGNEALYSYWLRTGDEKIRDALIFSGKSFIWRMSKDSVDRYTGFAYAGWSDYGWSGKKYSNLGMSFMSASAEGFGGLIFSYLASGDREMWKVCVDGKASWGTNPLGDLKALNYYAAEWKNSVDSVPPAAITDLSAVPNSGGGLSLSWTAPGGNGNSGKAERYQVKISTSPIVDIPDRWNESTKKGWPDLNNPLPYTNAALLEKAVNFSKTQTVAFWAAENVPGEPVPAIAGTKENMILYNLSDTSINYYIAIVTYDSLGNVSAISNVVGSKGTGIEMKENSELKFSFEGLSPNPFNPVTAIRYTLPKTAKKSPVVISILNVKGEIIRTIVNNNAVGGKHYTIWNGCDDKGKSCASGMYVYRFSWDNRVFKGRAVLLR
ncbi:MAG: hypothetical protein JNL74_22335 [Fibrobacteres bacterium]|nr:hypothetical protein [Fibrobacterota bacterium]